MNGPTSNAKEQSLLSRQDWYQRLVEVGGVVVFFGLLIEDGPELWEALSQHRLPNRAVIGGVIVAIGVGVEVLFASLVTHTSKRLQAFADARNAEFHERATSAERLTVELETEVEQLRKENEQERLERIKLERELSPRWFENQHEAIERLQPYSGTEVVVMYPPDLECARTAEQIAFVLNGAGWKFDPQPLLQLNPLCEEGITIEAFLNIVGPPSAGTVLIEELNKTGFAAKRPPGIPPKEPGPIRMWVGMKPRALDNKINQHITAMEKEILDSIAQMKTPDLSRSHEAIQEKLKDLKPGTHGGRLVLPRWPVGPPQSE